MKKEQTTKQFDKSTDHNKIIHKTAHQVIRGTEVWTSKSMSFLDNNNSKFQIFSLKLNIISEIFTLK